MADQLSLFAAPPKKKKPRSEAQKRAWRDYKAKYLGQEPYRTREFVNGSLVGRVMVHRAGGMTTIWSWCG